jgi:hypothetical protein
MVSLSTTAVNFFPPWHIASFGNVGQLKIQWLQERKQLEIGDFTFGDNTLGLAKKKLL